MNWITVAVLAILIFFGFYGWYKGILRIILSLGATIITILVTLFISPMAGKFIKENTNLYINLEQIVEKTIEKNTTYDKAVSQTLTEEQQSEYIDSNREISTYIDQIVGLLNLPDSMEKQVDKSTAESNMNNLINDSAKTVREAVTHAVAERLTETIFNMVIYIVIFIIVLAVFRVLIITTGVIGKLPVIHEANKLGGLIFGLVLGLVVVWLLFLVLTLFSSSEWAENALTDISNNQILNFMYNNNLILKSTFRNI